MSPLTRSLRSLRSLRRQGQWRPHRRRQGLLLGALVALFVSGLLLAGVFDQPNIRFGDFLSAPSPLSNKIVIVGIDDLSLGAYGNTVAGWPRSLHAELMDVLAHDGARVVAFDLLFLTPTANDQVFADAIRNARKSAAGTRTILTCASAPNTVLLADPNASFTAGTILQPVTTLRTAADRIGYVSAVPDADNYVRRLPLSVNAETDIGSKIQWSFDAATFLSYLSIPPTAESTVVGGVGTRTVLLTRQHPVPVDAAGQMQLNFFGPAGTFPVYSYRAVHDGEIDPQVFRDKIVLVGLINATGSTDRYLTPITHASELISGVEIQANAIESILQNRALTTQSSSTQIVFIVALTIVSGLIFSQMRWYMVLALSVGFLLLIMISAAFLFTTQQLITGIFYPGLAVGFVMLGTLILEAQAQSLRRYRAQRQLESLKRLAETTVKRLTLDVMFDYLADEIMKTLHCDQWVIWLWSEDLNRLELVRATASVSRTESDEYQSIANQALAEGVALTDDQIAVAPMRFQGRHIGVISGIRNAAGKRFSMEQLDTLRLLGEQSAPVMISAQYYTQQARQSELLEAILQSVPDPTLVLDQGLHLIRANPVAQQLLSQHAPGSSAKTIFLNVNISESMMAAIESSFNRNEPFHAALEIGGKNFILLGAPLRATQNGWVLVLNDVSTLHELDALKTQLLRMASHDLKNPLSVVLGLTNLMLTRDKNLTPDQVKPIAYIQEAAEQMASIIDDLLDLERVRAGQQDVKRFDLSLLLDDLISEYMTQATNNQQTLALIMTPPDRPIPIIADRRQIHEALSNLVSNALKYTPEQGKITVTVTIDTTIAHITITDTGFGIPKDAQGKLFQPFYRALTTATENIPGTGLGLSLVKSVVDAHRGKLWVESDEGRGSTFYVDLPLANDNPA